MNTASKLLIASAASVLLATAAASSGSGAVLTATKAHPGHGSQSVTPQSPQAKRFVRGVSVDEITAHQTELQRIASLNDDTREVFSNGYQESLDYVVDTLRDAGYRPQVTQFNFPVWQETQPPVLNQVTPTPKTYVPGDAEDDDQPTADFITMANSPTVELTNAPVFPVGGIVDPPTGGSTSGCAEADYAGVSGKVALVQRGTCAFVTKWSLAQAAGATGVIIYNEGNTPARQNPLFVDNQPDVPATIAAVITSYTLGNELLQAYKSGQNPTVDFKVYGTFTDRFLPQVLAETRGETPTTSSWSVRTSTPCRRVRASTTTVPAPRRCSPRPRSWRAAATSCATRSASRGGVPRRTASSGRRTTPTTSARRRSTRST